MFDEKTYNQYLSLKLHSILDYEKFNLFAITYHSTVIEGSTLTLEETNLLLNDNLTPKSKELNHSHMTKDHHDALLYILSLGKQKVIIGEDEIKRIGGMVMKNTGKITQTALGITDNTKGDYRLVNVRVSDRYFINYQKVPEAMRTFVIELNNKLSPDKNLTNEEKLKISFWAHFTFVSIHPFTDGNGRVSRLLMNYVQKYFDMPLGIVFKQDKLEYYRALESTRIKEDLSPFYKFMFNQYSKFLKEEIRNYKRQEQKGFGFFI
ncbi:MAG: Fic family protein [Bacteroidia bacterium]